VNPADFIILGAVFFVGGVVCVHLLAMTRFLKGSLDSESEWVAMDFALVMAGAALFTFGVVSLAA